MEWFQSLSRQGLYDPFTEHSACGVGFITSLKGIKSHDIVHKALEILVNLEHRGACGCDANTGDGAGVLIQIPHEFLVNASSEAGIRLPGLHEYGTGLVFLPSESDERRRCEETLRAIVREEGQECLGWRDVPRNSEVIGRVARAVEPVVRQIFIGRGAGVADDGAFERKLFVIRKLAERWARESGLEQASFFYMPSLSHRTLTYKGLLLAPQIRRQERSPEVDVSQVELVRIEQQEVGREQKLDLASGEVVELDPITSVGTGVVRDRRMALLSQIIERLNEQFAGEGFRDDQTVSYLEGRVAAMKTDESLVEQAMVNTLEQFLASPTLRDAAILAAYETDFAHGRMTELFRQNKVTEDMIIDALGRLFYLDLNEDAG